LWLDIVQVSFFSVKNEFLAVQFHTVPCGVPWNAGMVGWVWPVYQLTIPAFFRVHFYRTCRRSFCRGA
jgi:hypothetical protein